MSRLTEAFDEWVEITRECYASSSLDVDVVVHPGASVEALDQVEVEIGYSLAPEVRELYLHANGVDVGGHFLFDGQVSFPPLERPISRRVEVLDIIEILRPEVPNGELDPRGLPLQPFTLFEGRDGQVQVECSPAGLGAVSFLHFTDGRFFWVARSLTRYFEVQMEAFRSGELLWGSEWQVFRLSVGPRFQVGYVAGEITAQQAVDRDIKYRGLWRWDE